MCYLSLMFLPPKPQVAVDEDEEGAGGARDPVFLESSDFLRSLVDAVKAVQVDSSSTPCVESACVSTP